MLSVIYKPFCAECHNAECCYAECRRAFAVAKCKFVKHFSPFQQTLWRDSFIFKLSLPNVRLVDKPKKYICKYIKINNWSHAQIIFHRRPTSRGVVLNNDPMIWIGGARPSQKVLLNNFKLKLNNSFASIKNSCPPKKWQSHCQHK
jgi:hypothetical protein